VTAAVLLALALAGAADGAVPGTPDVAGLVTPDLAGPGTPDLGLPGTPELAGPGAAAASPRPDLEAGPPRDPPRPDRTGWRHGVALGPHATSFSSKQGSEYAFRSAGLGYLGSLGRHGPFLRAFLLLPLQASQDGGYFGTASYYENRSGADLLLGWQWRLSLGRDLEAEAGPGLHATFIYLPGRPGYRDFSAMPLGLGASVVLWWGTSAQRFSRTVNVGTYASLAYDFRDPLHANDLASGTALTAGVSVGLGARR
jgi:hypothetical protein